MKQNRPPIFIRTHFDACTGCQLCQAACSNQKFGGYNPRKSMLSIRRMWENMVHIPVVCEQCANPMCLRACPVKAISRDEQTGAVVIDRETCISCGLCSRYCPLEMIHVDPESGKAFKCDLCGGRPQCVSACPVGALELVSATDSQEEERDE
ncbi:Fe-S-cluster-containing dehydrogenase component [Desulfonatronum thiosulfatophilum]|uniref:Fe-S-cluster-containing dehydrogenase component n=1 Tax=Desulfonatronum thiosulfatophilum TaxID=617002 RepID=A0A1G6DB54_9BACT|nr:4Fe-4S dicluster domain-containing protein [Desulfonatronum thiosulfatophilum]SDB42358.1 Fe-S-cluster-containing dehydrogenase component [Desulfonatronum thiosulfatophilum]